MSVPTPDHNETKKVYNAPPRTVEEWNKKLKREGIAVNRAERRKIGITRARGRKMSRSKKQ